MQKVGYIWLQAHLKINGFRITHHSYIGSSDKIEIGLDNTVVQTFKSKYKVSEESPLHHLEFALKYDDLNLPFIKAVFDAIGLSAVSEYINANSNRKYARIIGYLYEFTKGETIDTQVTTSKYVDVLDNKRYLTGIAKKITKWKVNDNFLGNAQFCPIVRKTAILNEMLSWDVSIAIEDLKQSYSPEIFKRASYYLYKKESKSSSDIEQENPPQDRMEKFIALLEQAGQKSFEETLSEEELLRLQNIIVDPRFADRHFRNFQNYVGQTMRDYTQKIYYICPPPQFVPSLMEGLKGLGEKNSQTSNLVKAAIVSFGYVFIHPFEDGNGRIHRYLIHDILVRDGVVPNSTILPVSAQILANMDKYDATLENFSKQIEQKAKYKMNDFGELEVQNPLDLEQLYRFPDLTSQTVFLVKAIQSTIKEDVPQELLFLQCYDELKTAIQHIVDMPDNKIDRIILFLYQNAGQLSKRKRKFFAALTDAEIEQMETAYKAIFTSQKN